MKKIILSAFAALFLVGSAFAETVRMGTEGAYPPYNFINDNGEVDGFEKEFGYFTIDEIKKLKGPLKLPIERDMWFEKWNLNSLVKWKIQKKNRNKIFVFLIIW